MDEHEMAERLLTAVERGVDALERIAFSLQVLEGSDEEEWRPGAGIDDGSGNPDDS